MTSAPQTSVNASAHALYYAATHGLLDDAQIQWHTPATPACACCGRAWAATEAPGKAFEYQYSSSLATEWFCVTCAIPRVASVKYLGVERVAGKSSIPVGGKLGMLPGSGGLITPSGAIHLALPQGFIDKFEEGVWGRSGQLHRERPLSLLLRMLRTKQLADPERGFIYIEMFGRKPDKVMGDLRMTYDLRELWCNSDTGPSSVNLLAMLELAEVLKHHGHGQAAMKTPFWSPITAAAKGQMDAKKLNAWVEKTPGAREIVAALPEDPHDRIQLPSVMRILLEDAPEMKNDDD